MGLRVVWLVRGFALVKPAGGCHETPKSGWGGGSPTRYLSRMCCPGWVSKLQDMFSIVKNSFCAEEWWSEGGGVCVVSRWVRGCFVLYLRCGGFWRSPREGTNLLVVERRVVLIAWYSFLLFLDGEVNKLIYV